ncbi:MAG TPA: peptidoglycan-binding protein [Clostridia bacterium]|nr:peptidoglycan-binding protein [Clostridia bacterium]
MPQGTLIAEVHKQGGLLPIAGATVEVTSMETGETETLLTNSSGRTEAVSLKAPPLEASLTPDSPILPFSKYTVSVSADGLSPVRIVGVQVFPGIESIVPVSMEPLGVPAISQQDEADNPSTQVLDETVIEIPDPAVLNPEPRMPVGPQEPNEEAQQQVQEAEPVFKMQAAGFQPENQSLPAVYIPEAITVHLGPPSSNARNVTVSFTDYIKNVASSEIFPTWPESALTANIHAQVGFALNRIFTEWYPSRGFNFNITNSTAYDQAFIQGRNIYANISRLVDSFFNVYPRREGRLGPLFSSFCNGSTVTCPGLSQWGTVTLAGRGFTPLAMLRHYYGKDVELVRSSNIRGIQASYPGFLIRRGMQSEYVRSIQRQLIRIRQAYPAIPRISSATGYFGPETEAAVRAFQRIFDLGVDGIVGSATWYALIRVFTAVTGLAELGGTGIPLPGKIVPYPGHLLRLGSKGESVRILQQYLNDLSSIYGGLLPLTAGGVFGRRSAAAVLAFQKLFGLIEDGIAGPNTWDMLMLVWNNAF